MSGAAQAWEANDLVKLLSEGFQVGASASTVFFNPTSGVRCVVHEDDCTFLGFSDEPEKFNTDMMVRYEVTVRGLLGTDVADQKTYPS